MLVCRSIDAMASAISLLGVMIGASGGSCVLVMNPVAGPALTDTRDSSKLHWISSTPSLPTIFHPSLIAFRFMVLIWAGAAGSTISNGGLLSHGEKFVTPVPLSNRLPLLPAQGMSLCQV